ncbi:hypothetical protein BCR36DRAFT_580165 [Piromyces finnis]|uniref:Probable RNA polymerase II nuclear localization protein SLC7A6OS n=1 Tax=Piromyces finnis TaxID=1754191 RepID=A0A1Y1VKE1_9FUNG|nr:hypothetical protein BCR36DRAFT_580165 [Piromyces finnis]|eukprot:ORX58552.1 hypothetical protein BCR36DRAFT_580165 [Piromyces finnis]
MESTKVIENNGELPFTVLRIKRKRTEESPNTLIINENEDDLKRKKVRKTANPNRVFKLADSFDFQTFRDKEAAKKLKEHLTNIDIEKKSSGLEAAKNELMEKKIKESKAARYKVITKNRAMKTNDNDEDEYQLYDVVKEDSLEGLYYGSKKEEELMCNFNKMIKEYLQVSNDNNTSAEDNDDSQDNYVYDLYIPVDSDKLTENDVAADLIWEELDNNIYDYNEDDNSSYDSEDSNAEDYYQNEYPSSSEDEGGLYSSEEDDDSDDSDDYENDYDDFRGSYYPYKQNRNRFYNNFEYTAGDYDNDYGY